MDNTLTVLQELAGQVDAALAQAEQDAAKRRQRAQELDRLDDEARAEAEARAAELEAKRKAIIAERPDIERQVIAGNAKILDGQLQAVKLLRQAIGILQEGQAEQANVRGIIQEWSGRLSQAGAPYDERLRLKTNLSPVSTPPRLLDLQRADQAIEQLRATLAERRAALR